MPARQNLNFFFLGDMMDAKITKVKELKNGTVWISVRDREKIYEVEISYVQDGLDIINYSVDIIRICYDEECNEGKQIYYKDDPELYLEIENKALEEFTKKYDVHRYLQEFSMERAVMYYNDACDYLGVDCDTPSKELIAKLKDVIHSISSDNIDNRDWWAQASGEAKIILSLIERLNIYVDEDERSVLEGISNLF